MATNFSVILGIQTNRTISIWIDYNLNGIFELSERLMNLQSLVLPSGQRGRTGVISVPAGSETGQTRMRIIIRNLNNGTDPCISNSGNADVEDYTILLQNPPPVMPTPAFTSNQAGICNGVVAFQDVSVNQPTSWAWDFGDGSAISNLQNPSHTYQVTTPATYSVSLTVCNSVGCSTLVKPNHVVITTPCTVPYCASSGHNNSAQHIASVAVGTIINATGAETNAYSNFPAQTTEVLIGAQTNLTVLLANNTQAWQIAAWIDYNQNAVFEGSERLFFGPSSNLPGGNYGRTGGFTIPNNAMPGITAMRVIARQGLNNDPCAMNLTSAETEDYLVNLVTVASNNVSIVNITSPVSGCALSAASLVCVQITNFGSATQNNIPVQFTLNNAQSPPEIVPGPLASGASVNYCFTATANLAAAGNYNLMTQTLLPGDAQASNNTSSQIITSFAVPNSSFTYTNNGPQYSFSTFASPGTNYAWDFGDGTTSYFSNPVHTYSADGNYTVTLTMVTTSGCTSSSSQIITGVTGTEHLTNFPVKIYPNPSNGNVVINLPAKGTIELINTLGQMVYKTQGEASDNHLNLSGVAKGIYSLLINLEGALITKNLILQ